MHFMIQSHKVLETVIHYIKSHKMSSYREGGGSQKSEKKVSRNI